MVSTEYDSSKPQEQVLFHQDSNNNLNDHNEKNSHNKKYFNDTSVPELEGEVSQKKPIHDKISIFNLISIKKYAELIGENLYLNLFMVLITFWTLYQEDIRMAVVPKTGDTAFMIIASIFFFLYIVEIIILLIYKDDYFNFYYSKTANKDDFFEYVQSFFLIGSFYFWADVLSTAVLIFDLPWIVGDIGMELSLSLTYELNVANAFRIGIRFLKVIRFIRMVRIFSVSSLYQTLMTSMGYLVSSDIQENIVIEDVNKDDRLQSRVGAAMAEILSRRVLLLIIIMIILISILLPVDEDSSLVVASRMLNDMYVLNQIDSATYSSGLALTLEIIMEKLPVIFIQLDNDIIYADYNTLRDLRKIETVKQELNFSESQFYIDSVTDGITRIQFDQKSYSVKSAIYSIFTTTFLIVVFSLSIYFFSIDLEKMVIQPIEKLVALVEKISENPLGVEYNKMMGKKDGFYEGMETTVLLSTINKIGQLMRVGFGEAGAPIIAKNLSESSGGTLNLMGSGTLINSIFGFCDVRQFTDTTECLQEEVMLFVNRIAHILHSITVQCAGSANKNIGDAFLLTWKLDDKLTTEQASFLADQALLTFLKALVELCRHHHFICNFSENATQRLMKRFPGYTVRIGSGLHVGWAIEGAVGSNRKIDATYLSPHVSATEYLESSTKQYGVSLLMSEPFFKLLSPEANKHCRQVNRVRRSVLEMPIGIYTYDADLSIDWNDKTRYNLKDAKSRLQAAGRNRINNNVPQQSVETVNSIINRPYSLDNNRSIDSQPITAPGQLNNNFPAHSLVSSSSHSSTVDNLEAQGLPKKKKSVNKDSRRQSTFNFKNMLNHNSSSIYPLDGEDDEEDERKKASETAPTILVQPYTRDTWIEDKDVIDLRHLTSNENFRAVWEDGMNCYINGDWERARDCFTTTLMLTDNKDGPSKYLMDYMTEFELEGKSWPGYKDEASDE